MKLFEYYPVPSDRMSVIWSLLNIEGAIVLEYGPAGTTHYSMTFMNSMGLETSGKFYTTHMDESDVVMGDVERLEKAIVELDKKYAPKFIFVVGSSTAAVIGTDIIGICKYMQEEVKAKLITFDSGGFRCDYVKGQSDAAKAIIKYVISQTDKKALVKSKTYNILGASVYHFREVSNVRELQRLLKEAFGLEQNACLFCRTSVEALMNLGQAAVNVVLSREYLEIAQKLEEEFGTPYIYIVPYGYGATLEFLQAVGAVLGTEPSKKVKERILDKQRKFVTYARMQGLRPKSKSQAIIRGDYDLLLGMQKLLTSVGIKELKLISAPTTKLGANPVIEYPEDEAQWINCFKEVHKTLVIGDDVALKQAPMDNIKLRMALPLLRDNQIATHLPFMGEWGADYLFEVIKDYYFSIELV